jgi:undecaprenyl pyrophosphate phosphatase UppP
MDKKKFISQVIAAIVLYTVISVILEKDYSMETWLTQGREALIFGVIFGVLMWLRERFRKRE